MRVSCFCGTTYETQSPDAGACPTCFEPAAFPLRSEAAQFADLMSMYLRPAVEPDPERP